MRRAVASACVDIPDAPADPAMLDDLDVLDLDAVERDLLGVEIALQRLDEGTYRTDELDRRPIPDDVLERDPIARRAP